MSPSERFQQVVSRLMTNYNEALALYDRHRRGQAETIEDVARDPDRPTLVERSAGKRRWGDHAVAKGIVDDQKLAERKVALHAALASAELLASILSTLESMNQKLEQLLAQQ